MSKKELMARFRAEHPSRPAPDYSEHKATNCARPSTIFTTCLMVLLCFRFATLLCHSGTWVSKAYTQCEHTMAAIQTRVEEELSGSDWLPHPDRGTGLAVTVDLAGAV